MKFAPKHAAHGRGWCGYINQQAVAVVKASSSSLTRRRPALINYNCFDSI